MNLRYLHTFVNIAEVGSIARTAGRLNLSQPAASRQILALEAELGVRLFDRIGRRLRLTSVGEDLVRQSRRVLMEADSLTARARALKGGQTGILRVGATPMVIENMLSIFLRQYQARYPGVEVHFVEDGGLRLPTRLEHGDIHLALVVPNDRFQNKLLHPVHNLAVLPSKCRPWSSPRARRGRLGGGAITSAPPQLRIPRMVRYRLQHRAYQASGASGERGPSHPCCIDWSGLRHCGDSLHGRHPKRHARRTTGSTGIIYWEMVNHCLGSTAIADCIR